MMIRVPNFRFDAFIILRILEFIFFLLLMPLVRINPVPLLEPPISNTKIEANMGSLEEK